MQTEGWARAWETLEGSYGGYLSDVQVVWNRAVQENEAHLETTSGMEKEGALLLVVGLEVRCALIKSSIHSLAGNLPPKLPALLVENDLWTPAQALAHMRQMPKEWQKVEALKALAPVLAEKAPETMSEALEIARGIEDKGYRVKALEALAPHLAQMDPQELYPLWRETLPILAARPREELFEDIKALTPVIHALGGRAAVGETFRAVQDVGRWWP